MANSQVGSSLTRPQRIATMRRIATRTRRNAAINRDLAKTVFPEHSPIVQTQVQIVNYCNEMLGYLEKQ